MSRRSGYARRPAWATWPVILADPQQSPDGQGHSSANRRTEHFLASKAPYLLDSGRIPCSDKRTRGQIPDLLQTDCGIALSSNLGRYFNDVAFVEIAMYLGSAEFDWHRSALSRLQAKPQDDLLPFGCRPYAPSSSLHPDPTVFYREG